MKTELPLEPFAPHILAAIRTAFRGCWNELPLDNPEDVSRTRNKLVGTIANLASKGILDPHELKSQALQALGIGASAAGINGSGPTVDYHTHVSPD